jgi:hypothetical protein
VGDDYCSLKAESSAFKLSAFSDNTKRSYKSQLYCYIRFCLHFGLIAVPATSTTLCTYSSFLARTLSASSIPCYLNVIRILHIEAGYDNPLAKNWGLTLVKRGIVRVKGVPPNQKLPISVPLLLDLFRFLDVELACDLAFWFACLLAFYGLMRKSTLLPKSAGVDCKCVCREDIADLDLSGFLLRIKHTKTVQFGQKVLSIPFAACKNVTLCLVRTLIRHLSVSRLVPSMLLCNFVVTGRARAFPHSQKLCG